MKPTLIWRRLGLIDYADSWQAMQAFTDSRNADTPDELWTLQHPRVFSQGQAGKAEHLLNHGDIPVVASDRGGQVTYHGPGQWVAYVLFDLKRGRSGIRRLVGELEQAVISVLAQYDIDGQLKDGAPGVYVGERKIASLGLRVRRGCSYHGLSLNTNMDLEPFSRINPCGYPGLQPTQIGELVNGLDAAEVERQLAQNIAGKLNLDLQIADSSVI